MAETNYLNIYRILIGEKGTKAQIQFSNLYDYFDPGQSNIETTFKKIREAYVLSFNGKFKKGKNGKRALTAKSEYIKTKSSTEIIHGYVLGGITDADFELYKFANNNDTVGNSTRDDVLTQPYYFLIYMPTDSNTGIVLLHTNDSVSRGITSAFFDHLSDFLGERNFSLSKMQTTPKKISDEFYKNTSVQSIELIQHKEDERFNTSQGKLKKIKITHTMSGFKLHHDDFRERFLTNKKKLKQDIMQLIGLEKEDLIETVNIKVSDGKNTRIGTIEQSNYNIRIQIDESIKFTKKAENLEILYRFAKPYLDMAIKEL